jgi:hypothetical protein
MTVRSATAPSRVLPAALLLCCSAALAAACNEPAAGRAADPIDDGGLPGPETDAGPPDGDAGDPGPATVGPFTMTTDWQTQELDLFGEPGHRIWVEVSNDQLYLINTAPTEDQGGPIFKDIGPGVGGDIYSPGGDVEATFADHVVIEDAKSGSIADYGKMEVKLVGQFSRRQWTPSTIPNLRFDTDEFEKGLKVGGSEHFRLNNALVGTIFRELVAYRIYRALGYPAVRTSYAHLGSNVWGEDTWVPMVLVEVYKRDFCETSAELVGGGCTNMWEFFGDAALQEPPPYGCQVSSCDDEKLTALRSAVANAPSGPGFAEKVAPVLDWPMFHKFQCLSWILATPDDPIHASNNNLIIERDDGKLIWAPYSVDISQGLDNWSEVPLYGQSAITTGCQSDPACWADTIATCEGLIDAYKALKPETIVDEARATLERLGMLRPGDDERATQLRDWHLARRKGLSAELERYREPLDEHGCIPPQTWCESWGYCTDSPDCPQCSEELPYYCQLSSTCVASFEACADQCPTGMVYCEPESQCIDENLPCNRPIPI